MMSSPVIGPGVTAIVQLPEGGEGPVHTGLQPERAVPEVLPAALVQDDHVNQTAVKAEQEVQWDFFGRQIIHADQSGVFPMNLHQLQTALSCRLQQRGLHECTEELIR